MVTEWAYEYIIGFLAADKAAGKAFVKKLAPFASDDEEACFDALQLVPLGQPEAEPVAFSTVCPCKKDFYDFVNAVKEGADFSDSRYDYGKARDITLAEFNAIKSKVHFIQFRVRRDLTTNEEIPRAISLEQYLNGKGYQIKETDL
jgi:hypothetical protein